MLALLLAGSAAAAAARGTPAASPSPWRVRRASPMATAAPFPPDPPPSVSEPAPAAPASAGPDLPIVAAASPAPAETPAALPPAASAGAAMGAHATLRLTSGYLARGFAAQGSELFPAFAGPAAAVGFHYGAFRATIGAARVATKSLSTTTSESLTSIYTETQRRETRGVLLAPGASVVLLNSEDGRASFYVSGGLLIGSLLTSQTYESTYSYVNPGGGPVYTYTNAYSSSQTLRGFGGHLALGAEYRSRGPFGLSIETGYGGYSSRGDGRIASGSGIYASDGRIRLDASDAGVYAAIALTLYVSRSR